MASHACAKETCGKQEGDREDLEPWQRFAFECAAGFSEPSDGSSFSWSSFSWDYEDLDLTSLYTTLESERKDATPALGVIPDDEAIESTEKVVDSVGLVDPSETTEETASSFISRIGPVNVNSTGFEAKEVSPKMSDAEDPLEAQSDSEESCRKSKSKNPGNLPLRRSSRLLKQGPTATEKPPLPKRKATDAGAAPSCRRSKRIRDSKERESNKRKRSSH